MATTHAMTAAATVLASWTWSLQKMGSRERRRAPARAACTACTDGRRLIWAPCPAHDRFELTTVVVSPERVPADESQAH